MKLVILALSLFTSLAHADVSVPRAKQYLYTVYDVAQSGGESVAHPLNVSLPAGAIVTDAWVYINTQFSASGTESLAFQCAGTNDIMAYNSVKSITADKVLQGHLGATLFNVNAGADAVIGQSASANAQALNAGYGSAPSGCSISAVVRGDAGYTPYTAGKATLIIEYFKL